jgi:hypothetical protein
MIKASIGAETKRCPICGNLTDSLCPNCGRCEECCDCYECPQCKAKLRKSIVKQCPNCGRCSECCNCKTLF